jgi:hypothetical protein
MRAQLDFQKSIQKKRVVYKMTASLLFSRLIDNLIWAACIITTILAPLNKNSDLGIWYIFFALVTIWISLGLFYMNKLVVIKGIDEVENRKKITQILNQKYATVQLYYSGQNIIHYRNENALLFGWGKQITLIYNGPNFFINLATLGRYDIKSPFHAISNYYFLKSLKRKLETDFLGDKKT